MIRCSSMLFAASLIAGCATESSTNTNLSGVETLANGCVKIEGAELGTLITINVPDADGTGTVAVTFTAWIAKDGEPNEYIGFTLDADSTFIVKAGLGVYSGSGFTFNNPNGTGGPLVNGISNITVCDALDCDLNNDGDMTDLGECDYAGPPPSCDLNNDGDTTDLGECDYAGPPPDCDLNDDGDMTDLGECDYVPPPDCDLNNDGDTTDLGECDYVPPPDCDLNDDGDTIDQGECDFVEECVPGYPCP